MFVLKSFDLIERVFVLKESNLNFKISMFLKQTSMFSIMFCTQFKLFFNV